MGSFTDFLICAALALQIQSVLSVRMCRNPKGSIGEIIINDCYQQTCVMKGKRAVWEESLSMTCCYQRKEYQIGTTIKTFTNGCTNNSLVCAEKNGGADIELKVESDCPKPATEKSMLAQFGIVKDTLAEILNITDECCNKHPDDYEFLFLGPGYSPASALQAIVLNLPELSPSTVFPPPHPQDQTKFYGYVATVRKQQTLICGGYNGIFLDTCYLLKMFTRTYGYWMPFPPTHHVRYRAAAAWLGKDWWVTGGYNGTKKIKSTELLSPNDTWSSFVDLPEPVEGHSLVNIDSTTLFLCCGYTDSGRTDASYIYTPGGGFVKQPSMLIARWYQQCILFKEEIWVVGGHTAGGGTTSVEIFSPDTLTWRAGPALPTGIYGGDLLVIDGKLVLIGGHGGGNKIYQLEKINLFEMKWFEVGTLSPTRGYFKALKWKTYKDN